MTDRRQCADCLRRALPNFTVCQVHLDSLMHGVYGRPELPRAEWVRRSREGLNHGKDLSGALR